jgi:ActR/RegA family two-component response regulator
MAVYGAVKYLGKPANRDDATEIPIKRKSGSKRRH